MVEKVKPHLDRRYDVYLGGSFGSFAALMKSYRFIDLRGGFNI